MKGQFRPWVELWALIYPFWGPDSFRPSFKKQQGLVHPPSGQTLAGPGSSSALGPAHWALVYRPDVQVWSPSYPSGSPLALIPGLESWAWTCPSPIWEPITSLMGLMAAFIKFNSRPSRSVISA
ncbi:hypothetical protein DSO57_1018268 [Entomophthora muscae]|uniref:Uncharacterized protein n=1 Tax=Entomophthora muscae TaxID=34485 RepID=A0ACC2U2R2_9FUNG|nr:hypothetical protein DSO57_1018268 [Entomophthora muscae]